MSQLNKIVVWPLGVSPLQAKALGTLKGTGQVCFAEDGFKPLVDLLQVQETLNALSEVTGGVSYLFGLELTETEYWSLSALLEFRDQVDPSGTTFSYVSELCSAYQLLLQVFKNGHADVKCFAEYCSANDWLKMRDLLNVQLLPDLDVPCVQLLQSLLKHVCDDVEFKSDYRDSKPWRFLEMEAFIDAF
ncbi:hypothetical protein [Photobacterium leiognathi]|uniref:hypothetical protein n=1 Tax=Photobacterium leiognathi TaxID=553611 RepID=UPI0029815F64|nr:hypothetical protein [Photobacterium leiognathi]